MPPRHPRLQKLGCGKDGILASVGDHLFSHGFGGNGVGNDGAAEGGKHLIDNVADGQCLRIAITHLPQQQLSNNARENKQDNIRQVSTHDGADNAVNENRAGFFHLCANDEIDNAFQEGKEYRHENDSDRRCVQYGTREEDDYVDKGKQNDGNNVFNL